MSENTIEVKSISIDDNTLQNNIKPNFFKIDVEGAEELVLLGMKHTLQFQNLTLLVDIHSKQLKKYFYTDYKIIIKLLLANDFNIQNIDHRNEKGIFQDVTLENDLIGNTILLCTKKTAL